MKPDYSDKLKVMAKNQSRSGKHRTVHRDHDAQQDMLIRLRRVEGQVRGVHKMVEAQRYCPDILVQMSAVHESLRAVERILMKNHLQHCAIEALRSGDEKQAQKTYRELTELFYKHAR
jgi:CsoR family transcriptional regulator, copper-sensing transcriptional repressor